MKKQDKDADARALDAVLKAAQEAPPTVPEALMTRVLADAEAAQRRTRPPLPAPGLWAHASDLLGGWKGMGGLAAATCAGVWIGWSPPAAVPDAGALIIGLLSAEETRTTAELTGFGWDLDGG